MIACEILSYREVVKSCGELLPGKDTVVWYRLSAAFELM